MGRAVLSRGQRNRSVSFVSALEPRLLFSAKGPQLVLDHWTNLVDGPWQAGTKTIVRTGKSSAAVQAAVTSTLSTIPSYSTNPAGLPLLTQRSDGTGLKVFLDFDGYGSDTPFDTDGSPNTFNTQEQTYIYKTWRDIVSFFSPFDVNVTTVQPPTGGSNSVFVWQRISNSISGGAAYIGAINNSSSQGWNEGSDAINRHSGIAHEIGHQLGLTHQAEYDQYGNETTDYTDGYGMRDRPIMGVDFAENVRLWNYGRSSYGPSYLTDEMSNLSTNVKNYLGSGDGFRPDDFGGTIPTAATIASSGMMDADLERYTDADVFKLVSSGGTYHIAATPTYESSVAPKVELLDASGNIIASRDDSDLRNGNSNNEDFNLTLSSGTYYVRVTSSGDIGELGEYELTAAPLPSGWASVDINDPFRGGSATYNPTANTLTQFGGGNDIWSTADQFRFSYQILNGAGTITARIDSLDNTDFNAKAGVMMRQSLDANAPSVYVGIKPSGQLDPIVRASAGASSGSIVDPSAMTGPWVRIARVGSTFNVLSSPDGVTWTSRFTTTVAMSGPIYIGLATCSHSREATWSTFSNLTLTGSLGGSSPSTNSLPTPTTINASPAAGASTSVALSWNDIAGETGYSIERSTDGINFAEIGTVAANVTAYTDNNPFGSIRYFYRIVSLNTTATPRSVPSVAVSTVNKPAAPTIPDSSYMPAVILPNATEAYLNWFDVQGDEGYRVERSTDGVNFTTLGTTPKNATGYNASNLTAGTAYVFRISPLTSIGDGVAKSLLISFTQRAAALTNFVFTSKQATSMSMSWADTASETGYRIEKSNDGSSWSNIIDLSANTTSWTDTSVSSVNEYYYRISALVGSQQGVASNVIFAASPPSPFNLPSGWTNADIGGVGGSGTTSLSGTTYSQLGSGADVWNGSDEFQFASRALSGDGSITVRLASLENVDTYTKSGVMIRESNAANSKYSFVMLTPGAGLQHEARNGTGSGSFGVQYNSSFTGLGPVWLRLTRTGNVFAGSYSTDGATWTALGSTTIAMNNTVLMGLATTAHNDSRLARSTFDNVSVVGATGNDTTPPDAPIFTGISDDTGVSSTDGITSDNTLIINGTAEANSSVKITRVGTGVVGTVAANSNGVWSFDYTGTTLSEGNYSFTATATDAAGNVSVVSNPFNMTVDRTAPVVNSAFSYDTEYSMQLSPTSPDTAANVTFANLAVKDVHGTAISGTSINSAGKVSLPAAISDGNYTVTATVTDKAGNAASVAATFFVLAGDANHDRYVNEVDQAILTSHLNLFGSYSTGDFNRDGLVTAADQTILTANNRMWLPAPGPAVLTSTSGDDAYAIGNLNGFVNIYSNGGTSPYLRIDRAQLTSYIRFDGGDGNDTFTALGTSGTETVQFNSGSVSIDSLSILLANVEARGFDGAGGFDTLIVNGGPNVVMTKDQQLETLSLAANRSAIASVAAGSHAVVTVRTVQFGQGSIFDLNDNSMIVDYTGASPLSTYNTAINTARAGGAWTGVGLTSSMAKSNPLQNTGIGLIEASAYKSIYGPSALFAGRAIDSTALLIKYTYNGDADLNGKVDANDYARIDAGFQNQTMPGFIAGWLTGDFNYDGKIDANDYALIDGAFQTQGLPLAIADGVGGNAIVRLSSGNGKSGLRIL